MFKPATIALAISSAIISTTSYADDQPDDTSVMHQDLEVIVVSGSRTEKPLKDVAGNISVVTSADIEKQAIGDMNQLFKYDPSIQVTGSIGGAQNILVRGRGGDRVLMIKDGMRMNEGYGANGANDIVGRGFIETDTLKQVEVAKGASSSLYGSDALGGIIIFTTKDASDVLNKGETFGGSVKTSYLGSSNQGHIGANLALITGDVEHFASVNYRQGNEEQNYQESEDPFDIESVSLLYKAKYNIDKDNTFSFIADVWQQEAKGDSADGLLAYFRSLDKYGYEIAQENSTGDKTTQSFQLNYRSETETVLFDYLNVSLYNNNTEQDDEEYAFLDINAPIFGVFEKRHMWKKSSYEQDTFGLLSNATKKLSGTHTLGFGLDIEQTKSSRTVHEYREVEGESTKDLITNKFPENDVFRTGIFVNDEISLIDKKLIITPGARFDYYDMDPNGAKKADDTEFAKIDDSKVSFNLGALYKLRDDLAVFAQYGQGFKVPAYDLAYIEHYNQASSEYIYEIIPSDDLSPEESDSFEVGIRGHAGQFAFSVAAYYTKFDNFLDTQLVSREIVMDDEGEFSHVYDTFQYQNIDSVTLKGLEANVNYFIDNSITLFVNAAYQDGKNDETGDYLTTLVPLSGNIGVSYEGDNWGSELIVNWADKMTKVNEGKAEIACYGAVDWLFNYQINSQINVNLALNNIFDKEYVRYINIAGHTSGEDVSHFTESGRNLAANISFAF